MGFRRPFLGEEGYVPMQYEQGPVSGARGLGDQMAEEGRYQANQIREDSKFNEANRTQSAEKFGAGLEKAVGTYYDTKRDAKKDTMAEEQHAQQMAQGDQSLQAAERQNRIGESYDEEQAQAQLGSTKAQSELAGAQASTAKDAVARNNRIASEIYGDQAKPGETMADYLARLDVTDKQNNTKIQEIQAQIAKGTLDNQSKLLPLQVSQMKAQLADSAVNRKLANLNLSTAERDNRVNELSAQLQYANEPDKSKLVKQMTDTGAKPTEVAMAMSKYMSAQQQSQFLQQQMKNMDPSYAYAVQKTLEGKEKLNQQEQAIGIMKNALADNQAGNLTDDGAKARFKEAMTALGYSDTDLTNFEGKFFTSSEMNKIISKATAKSSMQMEAYRPYGLDKEINDFRSRIAANGSGAGGPPPNPFGAPPQTMMGQGGPNMNMSPMQGANQSPAGLGINQGNPLQPPMQPPPRPIGPPPGVASWQKKAPQVQVGKK